MAYNLQLNEYAVENKIYLNKLEDVLNATLDASEECMNAKRKVLKQLPNIYKNTRLSKFITENTLYAPKLEYKIIKGLVLNVQKRMCWYLNVKEDESKCLLISTFAKTAYQDLILDNPKEGILKYYCKFIFTTKDGIQKFVSIPLFNFNVIVI
jgi:hypothetical protein